MGFFSQLRLLLWKNLLLQKHKPCVTVFEILLPIFFALFSLFIHIRSQPDNMDYRIRHDETSYSALFPFREVRHVIFDKIGYTPKTPLTSRLMERIHEKLKQKFIPDNYMYGRTVFINSSAFLEGFDTEEELMEFQRKDPDLAFTAVVFKGLPAGATNLPLSVTFYTRPSSDYQEQWKTRRQYPFLLSRHSGIDHIHQTLVPQSLVAEALIAEWTNRSDLPEFDISVRRIPPVRLRVQSIGDAIGSMLPIFLLFSFVLSVIQITKSVVYEKERKLKESMKLMGLKSAAHWASWFITCFVYLAIAMAIYALIFGLNLAESGPIFKYSDASLFFVFLMCYATAILSFCLFVSAIVQRANVGAAVSGVFFVILFVPHFFLGGYYWDMTRPQKLFLSLIFNQAMSFGCTVIRQYESYNEGIQWSNMHLPAVAEDNFSLLDAMGMLLVDSAIFLVLAWYIDSVRPGEFGVPKPFYFCFTKTYWCGSSGPTNKKVASDESMEDEIHFERDPVGLNEGIRICNLSKTFGKNKVAVNNLSLKIYEGQITALLGHNGAGKTTTMSMLTGFFPPTSGTAYVNEKDICTDIDGVRESLGLCPQHNILFDTLTVNEHLVFFAKLKGCPSDRVQEEVDTMIKETGLEAKQNAQARTLSGGQKRKLSVAIALINGSKVVVLDEPTSGMDPAARRQTWEVLQRHRAGRTILLTTHFMDEADVLGERIAIMAEGVVKCCGSSLFLKKLYGAGYHLVVVKSSTCIVAEVTQLIQASIPNAQLKRELNAELTYLLPDDQSAVFPEMMRNLNNQKDKLGVLSFGATATTMEEVFLKVGESASREYDKVSTIHDNRPSDEEQAQNDDNETGEQSKILSTGAASATVVNVDVLAFSQGYTKLTGVGLWLSKLRGVLVKKAIMLWRQRFMTLFQLLIPLFFVALGCAFDMTLTSTPSNTTNDADDAEPPLLFSLEPYGETIVPYAIRSPNATAFANVYLNQFGSQHTTVDMNQYQSENTSTSWMKMADDTGYGDFRRKVIIGAEFISVSNDSIEAESWSHRIPYHGEPISLAYMLNALAKYLTNDSSVSMNMGIHPFPTRNYHYHDYSRERMHRVSRPIGFTMGLLIAFAMVFLGPSFIFSLIKERAVGAKHLQVVSGVGPVVFWLGTFIVDYINYLVPSLLMLVVFAAFGTEPYTEDGHLGLVLLVLIMYGWSILPFTYLVHFFFSSAPTGMVVCIVFNLFTGLNTLVSVFVLSSIPQLMELGTTLDWIFLTLFPNHCVGRSFMQIFFNYHTQEYCYNEVKYTAVCLFRKHRCCNDYGLGCPYGQCLPFSNNYLAWELPGIGRYVLLMFVQGLVFTAITFIVEYRLPHRLWLYLSCSDRRDSGKAGDGTGTNEDSDVAAERQRINTTPASELSKGGDSLLLVNLYRRYGDLVAVDHSCVGVPDQECFGLLGQNGAGKTTTFKMLTGEEMVSGGNAYVKGYDIKQNIKRVQENLGYCPQFDALLEQLTGRETLSLYARLRGVPESSVKNCVDSLMDVLLLTPHADKRTSDYSGGNKRKLSTAISVIGDPPFILLDEPSSGMDPGARRQLWNVLSAVRASGRTLVLTSHSMEECEALCTKIAIMVNGRFVCLGSTQHLKSKFGQGYTLEAKMDSQGDGTTAPFMPLVCYIQSCFPSAMLFDSHYGYVHMQIPDSDVLLADLFEAMEHSKRELHVQDYHVHQTTLEQVFLAFTRTQIPVKTDKKSCLSRLCFCKGKGQPGQVLDSASKLLDESNNAASRC